MLKSVLPVLSRHLTEEGTRSKSHSLDDAKTAANDNKHFRSFAVVCYAKAIRQLEPSVFHRHLRKLVNMVVVQGLRSRELSYREKARKSLLKLASELGAKYLAQIFDEMRTQLIKGFQEHVYLFSMHWLLDGLGREGKLTESLWASGALIESNVPILLSELYGELNETKSNEQHNAMKLIKEARQRKAMPIFEILCEHLDFETSFATLLSPIVKVLQESPSTAKITQSQELLTRLSTAVIRNPSAKPLALLTYLHSIIAQGVAMCIKIKINDEKAKRDYGATAEQLAAEKGADSRDGHIPALLRRSLQAAKDATMKIDMYWRKGNETVSNRKTDEICGRLLATFGLQCLKKSLK